MSEQDAPLALDGMQRKVVTGSIMVATIMQTLDSTIANVALPHMQGSFSSTQEQTAWVLTSYIVAAAIATPATGWLAGRFGRKNLLAGAVIGFTLSSMLCGAATSLEEMVLFRVLQGLSGAAFVPLAQSILLDIYPFEQRASAMAMWGVGVMVGPIVGPALGGYLTDVYNWRWVFYINVPFGIAALIGILASVPTTNLDRTRRFDWFGFAFLSLGIGAMQIMLDRGNHQDWFSSTEIVLEATFAVVGFYLFVYHAATVKNPFVELRIFKDRNLAIGLVIIFIVGMILYATMALLPPFLETLMGYPVTLAGLVLAPRGAGTMLAMLIAGRIASKVDMRLMIAFGLSLASLSLWEMAQFNLEVNQWTIIETGIVQGFGLGFIFAPLTTITFATLAPDLRTEGTSFFSLLRNVGSSVGISISETFIAYMTQYNHAELAAHVSPLNPAIRDTTNPLWSLTTPESLAMVNGEVTRQAATIAYLNDFRMMMYMTLLALPLLVFLRTKPHDGDEVAEQESEMAEVMH
ncbi:DHA2 family efflux MFS transporter permease subunit [Parvibaculum sp.]|uniref:DHA2 family efflux MFS transporter permease subunit n=1 Tax=Parvibaculum sp. TaxID=2024848 RepID=UPI000C91D8AA|nr:DHA2 family efflux MFS transporter permease subunit [Parvibaculum sp.]MAB13516.1 EmrB/QacA family drug resistance transporter [Parvibaculum sp.]